MNVEIVVARYNEDLKWLNTYPFNIFPITIYNKGVNTEFTIQSPHRIIQLDNVGRCDHTYLYHIVHNYNHLADITIFLPGSNDNSIKFQKSLRLISEVEKNNNTVFIGSNHTDVSKELYDFKLDYWKSTDAKNDELYTETNKNIHNQKDLNILELSNIRPFGEWYNNYFGDLKINWVSYLGIIGISKKHILNHPTEYYTIFLNQLLSPNPEVGHYIERSWCAIFHPLDDAIFMS